MGCDLEAKARGDANELVPVLLEAADPLKVDVEIVSPQDWLHGNAKGICEYRPPERPRVAVRDRENNAEFAVTIERSKRDLEAEAVGYIGGRYFGLDTNESAFYLAAWHGDEPETIRNRLERISLTAQEIIDVVSEVTDDE